ncbi:MAG: lipocalin family protein [Crocinitomicaceae bacterium]
MKKSIFLLAILLVGALSISAAMEKQLLGKWYVHSLKMMDNEETFDDEKAAPWMEFKEENIVILGEANRSPNESSWKYNESTNVLVLDSFGDEIEFNIASITDNKLVLEAEKSEDSKIRLILKRKL